MRTAEPTEVRSSPPWSLLLRRIATLWPAWLCLGLSLLAGAMLQSAHQSRALATQQQQLESLSHTLRDRLQAQATRAFSPTSGLATLIQVDGSISQSRLENLIERSLTLAPMLRSVAVAPDDVVRFVYPLAGNERALNLDFRTLPSQWAQVQQAKEHQASRLFAPVDLVQGGQAIVQRTPVFLRAKDGQGMPHYWGVISVVVDLDQFIAAAGITADESLEIALFSDPHSTAHSALIWGQWEDSAETGVSTQVELPGGLWSLRVRPRALWSGPGLAAEALAAWGGGSLIALLMGLLVRQSHTLRQGHHALSSEMARTRRVQDALQQSQAESLAARDRLQAVLDAATEVAIIATDLQGHVTVFNRGAENMLGYAAHEVLGHTPALWHVAEEVAAVGEAIHQPDEAPLSGFAVFARLAQTQGCQIQNWTFLTRAGETLQVSLALNTVRSADGTALGFLGVARDLSAQRRAENELRKLTAELEVRVQARTRELHATLQTLQQAQEGLTRAEKLAALGALVAGVAHELNTPIGNCLITASTLQEHARTIAEQARHGGLRKSTFDAYLQDMEQGTDILLRGLTNTAELVQHFKQLAVDQTSEQRRQFALRSVVDDVVSLSKAVWKNTAHRIEIDVDLPTALDSYPGALGRVLSNLMQNAFVHGFDGIPHGVLRISAHAVDAHSLELRVEDNGIGMRDEVRKRAFDPFFTTKLGHGGSGLGLNIVYNTVNGVLGGSITLHSPPGGGTQFIVRMPYQAPTLDSMPVI